MSLPSNGEARMDSRRKRTITDDDVAAIIRALEDRAPELTHLCSLSLEPEDARVLKEIVNGLKKARNVVGTVVLTFVLLGVLGLLTKGFWASMLEK